MAIQLSRLPQDCSVEKLFPQWKNLFRAYTPLGWAKQFAGHSMGYLKIPYWGFTFDPCEDNTPNSDGSIDNEFLIVLCKWGDGSPITVRYRKEEVIYGDRQNAHKRN